MLIRQFKLSLRALWRNRFSSLLNIAGLAIGLSAAWVVWQYTDFETSHDARIPNSGQVYRVVSNFIFDGEKNGNSGCPEPLWRAAESISGVEKSIPVIDNSAMAVVPEGQKSHGMQRNLTYTRPDYFSLVPYRWLAGSAATALSQPNQVVLTNSRAELYFPRHRPDEVLGKTIAYQFFRDTVAAEVVGVVDDLDFPSSFVGKEFLTAKAPKEDRWGGVNSNMQVWLVLRPGADPGSVEKMVNEISSKNSSESLRAWKMERSHTLQPLADVHFSGWYGGHIRSANPKVLATLSAIAVFLLLLACINYINLATAQIPARSREIGIRKTLGGRNASLIAGFLIETALVCLLAVGISALLSNWAFTAFKKDLPEEILKFTDWRKTALFLAILVTGVSLVSGLYPGWLMSRFQPVSLLRGQFAGQKQSRGNRGGMRKGLIVFQFFVAQTFIIGALVVGRQLNYMRSADLGFDREAVLTLDVPYTAMRKPEFKDKQFVLAESLRKLPEIEQVALGEPLLSNNYSFNDHERTDEKGQKITAGIYRKVVDATLLNLYRVPLLAGRNLEPSDTAREYIINLAAVKTFGFASPEAAVGQYLEESQGPGQAMRRWPIVGVVPDFHTLGFEEKIKPVGILMEKENLTTLNIRLASRKPADWQEALKKVEAEYGKIFVGEAFEAKFYDETLAEIYESDITLGRFINLATGIAIFISCLGLFGLATFMAYQRTKEIGIRKVLGASAQSIVALLSKEFLLLIGVAFLLAVPIAVYFLRDWLNDFAYRIALEWWIVALAGLLTLGIAFLTVSFQSIRAALHNPVQSLRNE